MPLKSGDRGNADLPPVIAASFEEPDLRADMGGGKTGAPVSRSRVINAAASPSPNPEAHTGESTALSVHPLETLITMRDRFLSECFDIESGRRFVLDETDAQSRLSVLRQRIDEIHEEMAMRDMGSSMTPPPLRPIPLPRNEEIARAPKDVDEVAAPISAGVQDTDHRRAGPQTMIAPTGDFDAGFQDRVRARIALLDRLAVRAEADGAFADAIQCIQAARALEWDLQNSGLEALEA